MTLDTAFNQWATLPASIAALAAFFAALVYGIGARWYTSLIGVTFFGVFLGTMPVFGLLGIRRLSSFLLAQPLPSSGDGWGLIAFILYTIAAVVWLLVVVTLLIERRSPVIQIPLGRPRHNAPAQPEPVTEREAVHP